MQSNHLAHILEHRRDVIVSRFVAEVERRDLAGSVVTRSLLTDHIPRFLDEIAAELESATILRPSQDAVDTSETARKHGGQRWALGYDLEGLIREYGVLRHCILEAVREDGASLSIDEFDTLAKCLSVGVAEAATAYVGFRDAQVNAHQANLDFLAQAGQLLSSSLDYRSTLSRLTAVIVPRMADWCAIHLDGVPVTELPIAHVDAAKRDLIRELYARFPLATDGRGHLDVMTTDEPQVVPSIEAPQLAGSVTSPAHLALLTALGTCSFILVPLTVQGHRFGAMVLAFSDSGRRYAAADLVLAMDLSRRAAVAIDNARLYELSQKERSRVEAATRAKDEFVAMVSHELRTPLNAILGWLRLMRSGSLPESKREHAFDVIERNANAQTQLVSDLLDISRSITGQIKIKPSQVDLANIIDMAIEGIRPSAEAKRIHIDLTIDRSSSVLRADGDRLQQVAWNLLANAIKFTPKNGRVTVRLSRVESDVELVVEDTGEGIPPSFLPFVFDIFRQSDTSTSRRHGGLGIGLSIAKNIVELHGGTIEAHSAGVGQGARFVVRLPISPLVSTTLGVARVPATKERGGGTTLAAALEGLRGLVVDDDSDARDLVALVLERSGMEVRSAESAAEAIVVLESFAPDMIISDIGMPGEDGYAFIRRVRTSASKKTKDTPAIALTAFASNEDRTRALVEGFNRHMIKPVEPAALVQAVIDLVGAGGARS